MFYDLIYFIYCFAGGVMKSVLLGKYVKIEWKEQRTAGGIGKEQERGGVAILSMSK